MMIEISDSYQEYKKKKVLYQWTKTKTSLFAWLFLIFVVTPVLSFLNPSMDFTDIRLGSTLISLLAGIGLTEFLTDFNFLKKYEVPDLENFAFAHLKKKYNNCIWLHGSINFQNGEKFYKVEKYNQCDDCLEIVYCETKSFHIETIK